MITSDIKKLFFSPSHRLVLEPHNEAGLERGWGGTIVITIRNKLMKIKQRMSKKNQIVWFAFLPQNSLSWLVSRGICCVQWHAGRTK